MNLIKLYRRHAGQKLEQRLSRQYIFMSGFFILFTFGMLMVFQVHQERENLNSEIEGSLPSIQSQLVQSLWEINVQNVDLILDGVQRLPSVRGVRVIDPEGEQYFRGSLVKPVHLVSELNKGDIQLGTLEIYADDGEIYTSIFDKLGVILVLASIIVLAIGIMSRLVIKFSITRHLSHISKSAMDATRLRSSTLDPIVLDRPKVEDELEDLVSALNESHSQILKFSKEREAFERRLEYQANYDALTGLPNRRHMEEYVQATLGADLSASQLESFTVLFIDLDGFKEVNDTYGHSSGDEILKECAKRLSHILSVHNGYVSRFGGDEFVACCHCSSVQSGQILADQIIDACNQPFCVDEKSIVAQLGCSIGIASYKTESADAESLIKCADIAMYYAKENGRNNAALFNEQMQHNVIINNKIKAKLIHAIENNLLNIHYQPLVDMTNNRIVGFEALARWTDDELGFIPPDTFIPIAEKNNLVFDIDSWVFETAIREISILRNVMDADYHLSVNFSPSNFYDVRIKDWIENCKRSNTSLKWVELEVTERLVLDDDPKVMRHIESFVESGLRLSVDDFGTGYSSLAYIRKFSGWLSKIKIDRSFINELSDERANDPLIESIVTLGSAMDIDVLAEGVETRQQEEALLRMNCRLGQGYLYSRPVSIADLKSLVTSWQLKPQTPEAKKTTPESRIAS